MIDPFLEGALEMWKGLAAASKTHVFANVVAALLTSLALFTWKTDFHGHSISRRKIPNLGPDSSDHTGRFVPETERFSDQNVAIPEV
jgi:hypothetical protein